MLSATKLNHTPYGVGDGGRPAAAHLARGPAAIGPVNAAIVWVLGRATGGGPPNFFTTLARHWLPPVYELIMRALNRRLAAVAG